jgi:hypothetical protein
MIGFAVGVATAAAATNTSLVEERWTPTFGGATRWT